MAGEAGGPGVILMNLGGPARPSAIRPFLTALFSDREIIRLPGGPLLQPVTARLLTTLRLASVRANYARIGGGSPLPAITRRQAEGLRERLRARGIEAQTATALRYTRPRADDALRALSGADRLVAVSLYPQYSRATTGSSLADLRRALDRAGLGFPLSVVDRYPDHPGYLDALADTVRRGLSAWPAPRRPSVVVLFSAHSLPERLVREGDPYVEEVGRTVAGVRERLPAGQPWRLAFQSRVGPVRWVGPGTEEVLRDLAREGARDVLVVPVSFVSDHLETLYEIDLLYGTLARRRGIERYRRAEALNDSPAFLEALADLVTEALR